MQQVAVNRPRSITRLLDDRRTRVVVRRWFSGASLKANISCVHSQGWVHLLDVGGELGARALSFSLSLVWIRMQHRPPGCRFQGSQCSERWDICFREQLQGQKWKGRLLGLSCLELHYSALFGCSANFCVREGMPISIRQRSVAVVLRKPTLVKQHTATNTTNWLILYHQFTTKLCHEIL